MSLSPTIMTAASMANSRLRSPLLATAGHDRTPVLRCIRRPQCASSSHLQQASIRLVPSHVLGLRTHTAPARRTLTATSATDTRTSGNSTTAVQADGSAAPASQPGVSWVDWLLYILAIALGTAGASAALVLYTGWEVNQAKDTLAAVRTEMTELKAASSLTAADPGASASATAEVKALRAELENLRQELKAEVQDLRGEIPGELQAVQQALQAEVQTLRQEVKTDRKVLRQGLKADIRDRKADINRLGVSLGKVSDRLAAVEAGLKGGSGGGSGSVGAGEKVASAPAAAAVSAAKEVAEKVAPAAEKAAADAE